MGRILSDNQMLDHMVQFGYLDKEKKKVGTAVKAAVKKLQKAYGNLRVDGELGPLTERAMLAPRCGVADILYLGGGTASYRWPKGADGISKVGVCIVEFIDTRMLSKKDQWDNVEFMCKRWSGYTKELRAFPTENPNEARILIGVVDEDGPSNTLGWCEIPTGSNPRPSKMMLDRAETWKSRRTDRGILHRAVINHEGGHGMGFVHSKKNGALMQPMYDEDLDSLQEDDDIPRAQARYGKGVPEDLPGVSSQSRFTEMILVGPNGQETYKLS